jgi:hypothetical protein
MAKSIAGFDSPWFSFDPPFKNVVFTNPIDNNLQELQQPINWRYHTSVEYEMLTNVLII